MVLTDEALVTLKNRTLTIDMGHGVWVDRKAFDDIEILMTASDDLKCSIKVEMEKEE